MIQATKDELRKEMDRIYGALKAPVESILSKHGIQTRPGQSDPSWLSMSWCPWCGHGRDSKKGVFECAVREEPNGGAGGGYKHAVNCMHPHKSPTGQANPRYGEFLVALGELSDSDLHKLDSKPGSLPTLSTPSAAAEGRASSLEAKSAADKKVAHEVPGDAPKRLSKEYLDKRIRRLAANDAALSYMTQKRGYDQATIDGNKFGLTAPYIDKATGEIIWSDYWWAPLRGKDGAFYDKTVSYKIDGVTSFGSSEEAQHRSKQKSWSKGQAATYYSAALDAQKVLFVCDGLKDLWSLQQLVRGSQYEAEILFVSSTNGGGGQPSEWRGLDFWLPFEKVYAGHDNDREDPVTGRAAGDMHAQAVAKSAHREVLRVKPPGKVKDWNDWVLAGGTVGQLIELMGQAQPIQVEEGAVSKKGDDGKSLGRFSAQPIKVVGAYHNGFIYEAVNTLVRRVDEDSNQTVELYDTVVFRSDGYQLHVREVPAPKGTPGFRTVLRLSDNTLLKGYPEPNPFLTWRWDSIRKYLQDCEQARKDNKAFQGPELAPLLRKIIGHLKASVYLPKNDDYTLLACTVVVSYCQVLFDAVPLILVTGARGTGKSELGSALKSVGANAQSGMLGQVTAASIARFIDATRGLVVLDDLEQLASAKDAQFSDLAQALKLSYKKETAKKLVTVMKERGRSEQQEFNFFGVKIINNTRGTDDILGSRMFVIQTRQMPAMVQLDRQYLLEPPALAHLRDQLHTWAFANVAAIAAQYQATFPNKSNRSEEIAAPLKVIAALSADEPIFESLERALESQKGLKANPASLEELMKEALREIIRRSIEQTGGFSTWVTVTQLMMEMQTMVDTNYGKESTTSLAEIERPEIVGRSLSQLYADSEVGQKRTTMYSKTLRAYKLSDDFVQETKDYLRKEKAELFAKEPHNTDDFKAFCQACSRCPYVKKCEMQANRADRDNERSDA